MKSKKYMEARIIPVMRRQCQLCHSGVEIIDYKDVEYVSKFLTEKGKIIPRRISGLCSKHQKMVTRTIKRCRNIALISFAEGYIEQDVPLT